MSENRVCPKCHQPLPPDAPSGICPQCLLAAGIGTGPSASAFTAPKPEELAADFDDLEIQSLLGSGGMGAVYQARQTRLDRLVAVKILPPEVGQDPAFAARFEREAQTLAKLNHPNIVQIYDYGQRGKYFYLIMEFVDGVNLRQTIRSRELLPAQALTVVQEICSALQFAHDAGVVHRDIKPENILIDRRGRVKIADFGLAMLLNRQRFDVTLTGTHQVMGTPNYMAPEQLRGAHQIDHRADIYSLGVVFYELLTGELPVGHFEVPSKKIHVDVRLDEVVLRTLATEPNRRYQHASDLQHDVASISTSNAPGNIPGPQSTSGAGADPRDEASDVTPSGHGRGDTGWSTSQIVLVIVGNLWLLAVVLLLLGKKVARTQPLMYSFFDLGAWLYPSTYHAMVIFCAIVSMLCFLFAWHGRREHHSRRGRHGANAATTPTIPASSQSTGLADSGEAPRLSRLALWGAAWSPFFFLALVLFLTVQTVATRPGRSSAPVVKRVRIMDGADGLNAGQGDAAEEVVREVTQDSGVNQADAGSAVSDQVLPGSTPLNPGLTRWKWLLILTVLPLGLTAPIGTTALGLAAVSGIRHSRGTLTGMPLAVADTLLFPLLVLDALITALVFYASYLLLGQGINLLVGLAVSLVVCLPVDALIVRAVWRQVSDRK